MENSEFLKKALLDPNNVFHQPEEVLIMHTLTYAEKVKILQQWKYDAILMQTASMENMSGGENDRLDRVMRCLEHLKKQKKH